MKKNIHILWFLSALVLLAAALAGCGGEGTAPDETSAGATESAEVTAAPLPPLELYGAKVIIPENCTAAEAEAASTIRDKIKSVTGVRPELGDDFIPAWKERETGKTEILVGVTNYAESAAVLEKLTGIGDYAVAVQGNKVVVIARSPDGMSAAAKEFGKLAASVGTEKSLPIPADTFLLSTKKTAVDDLPLPEGLPSFSVWLGDNGFASLICSEADAGSADKYGAQLTAAGYSLSAENKILGTDNLYRAYVKGDELVTLLYTPHDAKLRIMPESLTFTSLPQSTAPAYQKVCDPFFIQVGVCNDTDPSANGMSYLYRLSDGSFMVWDGGFDDAVSDSITNNRQNGTRLYALMKQYAPDPENIRVALWVITHPHIDHGGALQYFGSRFVSDKVKIERILCWLPSAEQCTTYTDGMTYEKTLGYFNFYERMKQKGTGIVRAHPGQVFALADARVEVLYSDDMMLPANEDASNPLSVVCRVSLGGTTVLMTGDTTADTGGKFTTAMYGSAMSSDFLQLPHHSFNIMKADFYKAVSPKYVLVPIGKKSYDSGRFATLLSAVGGIPDDRIYPAFFTQKLFPLPFTGTGMTETPNTTVKLN